MKYNHKEIDKKWQERFEQERVFEVKEDSSKEKFFGLVEFPYPSGAGLHVGHPRSYTAMDVICRKKRMDGFNALYPIGFDAFGLPTENFAIKTGRNPKDVTAENIATFTRQLKEIGFSFDWSRVVDTTDPGYYKWTQWIFMQFFKHGLAYKKNTPINWCLDCKIGLANEEVVDGGCERCGGPVEKRDKEQWMLAITEYADSLLEGLDTVDYVSQVKAQQTNWIGRSEGAEINFVVEGENLTVFTTRPDTIFGATYMVIAPEHDLIEKLSEKIENLEEVKSYIQKAKLKSDLERTELQKEKTGIELKGLKAINPVNNKELPIFVADYVLGSYGTGAIMAVPAHDERDFEFAKKYDLEIEEVVRGFTESSTDGDDLVDLPFIGKGIVINSDFLNGLTTKEATDKIISWLEEKNLGTKKVQYKLRDWVFSRQRYWGEPIPLVYCEHCAKNGERKSKGEEINPGWIPLDEKSLPLELPEVEKYEPTDTGESPLAAITDWVETTCPRCESPAKRETDTMPNWAGSSWYYLRYMDPNNSESFASAENLKYWGQVDWYNGGMEHAVLHLLYSRFWNHFLFDIGVLPHKEPYAKRTAHGMILAKGGEKMSKSKGNVVNPDDIVEEYGADVLRTYIMFMGPFDQAVAWDTNGLVGVRRFLERIFALSDKVLDDAQDSKNIISTLHKTIKKVGEDIDEMRFNTAIAKMMEFSNELGKQDSISKDTFESFLRLLNPFAPHITEEIAQKIGIDNFVCQKSWPEFKDELCKDETITLAIQVNGKVRDQVEVDAGISEDDLKEMVLKREKLQSYLDGKEVKKFIYVKGRLVSIVI